MKKFIFTLLILFLPSLGFSQDNAAEENAKLANAVIQNAKLQGTVTGMPVAHGQKKNVIVRPFDSSAIIDDLIAKENDIFKINDNGNLVSKLLDKEKDSCPPEKQVKIVQIYKGGVIIEHLGVKITLEMAVDTTLPRCEFKTPQHSAFTAPVEVEHSTKK